MSRRTGKTIARFADIVPPAAKARGNSAERAAELIRRVLAAGPMPTKEVAALGLAEGFSERTVQKAARNIGVESTRIGGSDNCRSWALPKS